MRHRLGAIRDRFSSNRSPPPRDTGRSPSPPPNIYPGYEYGSGSSGSGHGHSHGNSDGYLFNQVPPLLPNGPIGAGGYRPPPGAMLNLNHVSAGFGSGPGTGTVGTGTGSHRHTQSAPYSPNALYEYSPSTPRSVFSTPSIVSEASSGNSSSGNSSSSNTGTGIGTRNIPLPPPAITRDATLPASPSPSPTSTQLAPPMPMPPPAQLQPPQTKSSALRWPGRPRSPRPPALSPQQQPMHINVTSEDIRETTYMLRQLYKMELHIHSARYAVNRDELERRAKMRAKADLLREEIEEIVRIWSTTDAAGWTLPERQHIQYCQSIIGFLREIGRDTEG